MQHFFLISLHLFFKCRLCNFSNCNRHQENRLSKTTTANFNWNPGPIAETSGRFTSSIVDQCVTNQSWCSGERGGDSSAPSDFQNTWCGRKAFIATIGQRFGGGARWNKGHHATNVQKPHSKIHRHWLWVIGGASVATNGNNSNHDDGQSRKTYVNVNLRQFYILKMVFSRAQFEPTKLVLLVYDGDQKSTRDVIIVVHHGQWLPTVHFVDARAGSLNGAQQLRGLQETGAGEGAAGVF